MKRTGYLVFLLILFPGMFLAGILYDRGVHARNDGSAGRRVLYYVDPMNPSHTSDRPGLAPCGMRLEPVYADTDDRGQGSLSPSASMVSGTVKIGAEKQQLIGVRLGKAELSTETLTLRVLGRVVPDQNRICRVLAPRDGYMGELESALPSGTMVQQDQLLASYYSVDSLPAQQSYVLALNAIHRNPEELSYGEQLAAGSASLRNAEDNLKLYGLGEAQIREIARSRKVTNTIEVRAPFAGLIVSRNLFPYSRFDRDTEFFRIVDISRVWIVADLFGNEEQGIQPGSIARVTLPGRDEAFEAKVSDALPQFDPGSRTYKVRLEVDNRGLILRPEAFVDVEFSLPMPQALTVPVEAVLDSGLKKTVFVDLGNGTFEPREVRTGWISANRVEIRSGLMPEERVVVSGNFLIDSESRMKRAAEGSERDVFASARRGE